MALARMLSDATAIAYDRLYQIGRQLTHHVGPSAQQRYPGGDRAPVLLLPGVYETWEFLKPVADALYRLGHPIHTLPELGYNRKSITLSAEIGSAYLAARNLTGVVLVGHSKGGIIGKRMMLTDASPARISTLIAVCSPFTGSTLARFAPNPALRAFSPSNRLLLELDAQRDVNSRITSIYSRLDPLIPNGSHLEGAENIELPLVGHFRPLASRLLVDEVVRKVGPR